MKKTLLLLATAALLLVGCAKEKFAEPNDGGLTSVTFSASVDGGVATKAAADNDGNGTNVNRCIMEIYFQNQLFKRLEATMSGTPATATFANVPVVAGKEYQILFWADCVDDAATAEGLEADKYYTTTSLKSVTVAKAAFIGALEAGDNDKLDAFCFAGNYIVPQNLAEPYTVTLKRPFAQLNVITTDVAEGKTVTSEDLLPEKVSVSYKAADVIDVATGAISSSEEDGSYTTYTYEADVYGNWSTVATKHELTLSMDYILASTTKDVVDVTFITKNGEQNVMTHSLTNLPYQRNYRTNVKGDLLTAGGTWTATIDPEWGEDTGSKFEVQYHQVYDIAGANEFAKTQSAAGAKVINVEFAVKPNDAGDPTSSHPSEKEVNALVTTELPASSTYNVKVATATDELFVGDYVVNAAGSERPYNYSQIEKEEVKNADVNLLVTENSYINKLVINSPSKSVNISGTKTGSTSVAGNHIDGLIVEEVSMNTVVLKKGAKIGNLTMKKGTIKIFGSVTAANVIESAKSNTEVVKVRDCYGLSQSVYEELEPNIDRPDYDSYSYKVGEETRWNIVPVVCKIGDKGFASIKNAVASVTDSSPATIIMVSSNVENITDGSITIPAGKNITLDLNGKEVSAFSANGSNHFFVNNGELTVKDSDSAGKGKLTYGAEPTWEWGGEIGHYEGSYASNLFKNSGTLTLKNGNYYNMASGSACYIIDLYGSSYAKVENGYYYAVSTNFRNNCGTNTLEIFDGKFEAEGYNVNNHGNQSDSNVLKIHGGHFSTTSSYNIYSVWNDSCAPTNCKVFIDGGEFEGYVMVDYIKDVDEIGQKNVIISGGQFWYFYDYRSGVKSITGGIHTYINENWVVDGYKVVDNTDADTKAQYPWKVIEDV